VRLLSCCTFYVLLVLKPKIPYGIRFAPIVSLSDLIVKMEVGVEIFVGGGLREEVGVEIFRRGGEKKRGGANFLINCRRKREMT